MEAVEGAPPGLELFDLLALNWHIVPVLGRLDIFRLLLHLLLHTRLPTRLPLVPAFAHFLDLLDHLLHPFEVETVVVLFAYAVVGDFLLETGYAGVAGGKGQTGVVVGGWRDCGG